MELEAGKCERMNLNRAITLPMYGSPRKCWLCGRIIDTDIVSCHFFDFDVKQVKLRVFHTHTGCAKRAGLVKEGIRWKISQHDFMRFWYRRSSMAEARGEEFGREYGLVNEPWPHTEGLSEQEAAEWETLRAKAAISNSKGSKHGVIQEER